MIIQSSLPIIGYKTVITVATFNRHYQLLLSNCHYCHHCGLLPRLQTPRRCSPRDSTYCHGVPTSSAILAPSLTRPNGRIFPVKCTLRIFCDVVYSNHKIYCYYPRSDDKPPLLPGGNLATWHKPATDVTQGKSVVLGLPG